MYKSTSLNLQLLLILICCIFSRALNAEGIFEQRDSLKVFKGNLFKNLMTISEDKFSGENQIDLELLELQDSFKETSKKQKLDIKKLKESIPNLQINLNSEARPTKDFIENASDFESKVWKAIIRMPLEDLFELLDEEHKLWIENANRLRQKSHQRHLDMVKKAEAMGKELKKKKYQPHEGYFPGLKPELKGLTAKDIYENQKCGVVEALVKMNSKAKELNVFSTYAETHIREVINNLLGQGGAKVSSSFAESVFAAKIVNVSRKQLENWKQNIVFRIGVSALRMKAIQQGIIEFQALD